VTYSKEFSMGDYCGGLGAGPPAAGGHWGPGKKSPAAWGWGSEENLQSQDLAIFAIFV